jgi:decaprenylphospho-beta-D-ribofuranose 2-oxidase
MRLSGWGRYPTIDSRPLLFNNLADLAQSLPSHKSCIPFGHGRSYGDSALAKSHIPMRRLNRILAFDSTTGLLTCESGVLLSEIIEVFLPRGWFLKITPGTKLITVGGAIASDVHGKNHHIEGCFSECLEDFQLLFPDGTIKICSSSINNDLFNATCGGMGLTGVITQASFYLKRVKSQWINQTTIKTNNLEATFKAFETNSHSPYSVAWIDCLAKGDYLGRSLLMLGDFSQDGDLNYLAKKSLSIPINLPSVTLNSLSVKIFNALYYQKTRDEISIRKVGIDSFFYPLDSIQNWNRIYGKNGFIQFQFILPKAVSYEGLKLILERISASGMGSFLAVLKLYGKQNQNWLSFPLEGYSLALDFKIQKGLIAFIDELSQLVANYGGRIYLAKDALLKREVFERGYPNAERFRLLRERYGLNSHFQSLQSQRLGL